MADESAEPLLAGLRVVETSRSVAGAYAGRILADCGAEVILAEPEGGHPLRARGPLFAFLSAGKRPSAGDVDADVLIREWDDVPGPAPAGPVTVDISPWGSAGPWPGQGRPWTDFTLQAECGSLRLRGVPDSYPLMAGGRPAEWVAGALAATAALAGVRGGGTARADIPLLGVNAYVTNLFVDALSTLTGASREPVVMRRRLSPSVEPTADGWVGFNLASAQQLQDFMILIERPDLLEDQELSTHAGRYAREKEWTAAVHAWTTRHTTAEILERAALFRIPASPVHSGTTILRDPHVVARGFYVDDATGTFKHPAVPFLFDGRRPQPASSVSSGGDPRPRPRTTGGLPLAGLRVLDLGTWWAGSFTATLLASLGADVIKVESTRRIDGARVLGGDPSAEQWWERGYFFLGINHNKRAVTLDLTQPEGLDVLKTMIAGADVLLENFAPRVMENLGLDWDGVRALNPSIVMLRMPAFGLTGPLRDRVGYAQTVEQYSGLCWVTGYPDGPPVNPSGPADPMGGANAAAALLAALHRRAATGQGMLVEAPLAEAALTMAAEQVIEATATGVVPGRAGNHAPGFAPQGVYRCEGSESWLAISVATDAQWAALRAITGLPRWHEDASLATYDGRKAQEDLLDRELQDWASTRRAEQTAEELLRAGVPAAVAADPRFIHDHPQLGWMFEEVGHPVAGKIRLPVVPFAYDGVASWSVLPPPTLGRDNREVLSEVAGLSPAEIDDLIARGICGTHP